MIEAISYNSADVGLYSGLATLFWGKWLDEPEFVLFDCWVSDVDRVAVFSEMPDGISLGMEDHRFDRMFEIGSLTVLVQWAIENNWSFYVAGPEQEARDFIESMREMIPQIVNDDENFIPIAFWALNAKGEPDANVRKIDSHKWPDIRDNYAMEVRTRLDDLMSVDQPDGSGKLVLWHGPPGTGKTNCIRALAHSWRDWCDVDYIVDPEALFGRAHYMMNCLVNGRGAPDRWRLIVIEDSGEFLKKDARSEQGQAFGRLLNLTDGLVGQGLNLIILVTTNEPFGDLHPAISRPGRCLAHLEFGLFPPEEASKWLGRRVSEPMTLADMYEARAEVQPQITKDREEFRPGMYV